MSEIHRCDTRSIAVPGAATPIFLRTYLIDSTKAVDAKAIDFRMRDGRLSERVAQPMSGLNFGGFTYVTDTDEICGDLQSIRVLKSHQVCMLGVFTKLPPSHQSGGQ